MNSEFEPAPGSSTVGRLPVLACCLLLTVLTAAGCGSGPDEELPPRATVTGTVTLDNQPLEGATVMFTPQDGGAISTGTTDAAGRYKLRYGASEEGAALGTHRVQISRYGEGDDTTDIVPEHYNVASTLESEVTEGENVINFDLKSDPQAAGG